MKSTFLHASSKATKITNSPLSPLLAFFYCKQKLAISTWPLLPWKTRHAEFCCHRAGSIFTILHRLCKMPFFINYLCLTFSFISPKSAKLKVTQPSAETQLTWVFPSFWHLLKPNGWEKHFIHILYTFSHYLLQKEDKQAKSRSLWLKVVKAKMNWNLPGSTFKVVPCPKISFPAVLELHSDALLYKNYQGGIFLFFFLPFSNLM